MRGAKKERERQAVDLLGKSSPARRPSQPLKEKLDDLGTNQVADTCHNDAAMFPTIAATTVPYRRNENSSLYVSLTPIERDLPDVIKRPEDIAPNHGVLSYNFMRH